MHKPPTLGGVHPLGGFAVRTTLNSQVWRPRARG